MTINGHKSAPPTAYRAAEEREDVQRPPGHDEAWRAYHTETGAYVGVVMAQSVATARKRACDLYGVEEAKIRVERGAFRWDAAPVNSAKERSR